MQYRFPGAHRRDGFPLFTIWELPQPDPLAFPEKDPSRPLPLTVTGRGVTVDLASRATGGAVVVNFLRATLDARLCRRQADAA